ncbi:MAG: J domain-containing protein [Pseudomonadota bacterium]
MFWTWNAVVHVILLQAALAFYFLIWPILRATAGVLTRRLAAGWPQDGQSRSARGHADHSERGRWRDTQYQRAENVNEREWAEHRRRRSHAPQGAHSIKARHLKILGLSEPVHLMDIKTAYRDLAKTYHPDRFASDQYTIETRTTAAARMRDVNAAYDWLCANA